MMPASSATRGTMLVRSTHSAGAWSSPPTGPKPSIVGVPAAEVKDVATLIKGFRALRDRLPGRDFRLLIVGGVWAVHLGRRALPGEVPASSVRRQGEWTFALSATALLMIFLALTPFPIGRQTASIVGMAPSQFSACAASSGFFG